MHMMESYRSNHPNHVHQLVVAVSKHYYASKQGELKYQQKPMEVPLTQVHAASRCNMIVFVLRDHCSGVFYSEIAFCRSVPHARAFLGRAWAQKSDYVFHGLPQLLTIPRTVQEAFPSLASDVQELGIGLVNVTSGFQSGIRDIKTIERSMPIAINHPIARAHEWLRDICISRAEDASRVRGLSKIEIWQSRVPTIRLPPVGWGSGA
jgi:hypothetical protein